MHSPASPTSPASASLSHLHLGLSGIGSVPARGFRHSAVTPGLLALQAPTDRSGDSVRVQPKETPPPAAGAAQRALAELDVISIPGSDDGAPKESARSHQASVDGRGSITKIGNSPYARAVALWATVKPALRSAEYYGPRTLETSRAGPDENWLSERSAVDERAIQAIMNITDGDAFISHRVNDGISEHVLRLVTFDDFTCWDFVLEGASWCRFPGFTALVMQFALQGMAVEGIKLVAKPDGNDLHLGIGAFGVALCVLFLLIVQYYSYVTVVNPETAQRSFTDYEASLGDAPLVCTFWLPRGYWRSTHPFHRMWGPYFGLFLVKHMQWVPPVAIVKAILIGIAVSVGDPLWCRILVTTLAAVFFLFGAACVFLHPHRRPTDEVAIVIINFCSGFMALAIAFPEAVPIPLLVLFHIVLWTALASVVLAVFLMGAEYWWWRPKEEARMKEQEEAELNLVLIRLQRCVEGNGVGAAVDVFPSLETAHHAHESDPSARSFGGSSSLARHKRYGSFSSMSSAKVSDRNVSRLPIPGVPPAGRTERDSGGSDTASTHSKRVPASLGTPSVTPHTAGLALPPLAPPPGANLLSDDEMLDEVDDADDDDDDLDVDLRDLL